MEMMCAISGLCPVQEGGGFLPLPIPPSANWNVVARPGGGAAILDHQVEDRESLVTVKPLCQP